jgi:hypothetical protein
VSGGRYTKIYEKKSKSDFFPNGFREIYAILNFVKQIGYKPKKISGLDSGRAFPH